MCSYLIKLPQIILGSGKNINKEWKKRMNEVKNMPKENMCQGNVEII